MFISACADAYLTPHIKKYVAGFASGFKDNIKVQFFDWIFICMYLNIVDQFTIYLIKNIKNEHVPLAQY